MRTKVALLGLAVTLAGCASAPLRTVEAYSPSEVLAQTEELDGKEISVRGWLGGCKPTDNRICGLYSNRRAAAGPQPQEWPLPIELTDDSISDRVRPVIAHGRYIINCRNTETSICVEYDGYFQVDSVED